MEEKCTIGIAWSKESPRTTKVDIGSASHRNGTIDLFKKHTSLG